MQYTSAGCLFINERDEVLTGWTPKHKWFSGFGGKKEPYEMPRQTAIRETLEELFGIKPSMLVINQCIEHYKEKPLLKRNGYMFIVLTIAEYSDLAAILIMNNIKSPYYDEIPQTVYHLIFYRKSLPDMEITTIRLTNLYSLYEDVDPELKVDWMQAIGESEIEWLSDSTV
jgi:hypothetical protein